MRPGSRIAWKLGSVLVAVLLAAVAVGGLLGGATGVQWAVLALVAVAAGLSAAVLIGVLARRLIDRPVLSLAEGIEKMAEGDLGFRFEVRGDGEFATLERTLNALAEKLEPTLAELRDTRDYFEGIVETSADIIVTVSPSGYVYTFNRGAEETLGYARGEVIGRRVDMLFADPEERVAALERLRDAESVVNYETRLLTKEGEIRDVMLTLSRLPGPEGRSIGTFGIAKDVTESKRLQKRLLQTERLAAIGQALAGIQHSLKNMLNVLKGGSYMVRLGLSKGDQDLLEEGWDMVQGGIHNLTSMSAHMLSFAREWKPRFERVDIGRMVTEIEGLFRTTAEDRGVRVRVDVPDDPPPVLCDAKLVHAALVDILSNALDACLEKDYSAGEKPEISIWAHPSATGSEFILAVRDNGCGMSEEVQRNVFTPFFSTKKSFGTGLGLALTARTIRLHEGEIEVESQENVGSEFRIIVPVGGPESGKEEPDGEEGAGRG